MAKINETAEDFERLLIDSDDEPIDNHSSDDEEGDLAAAPDTDEESDDDSISDGDDIDDDGWTENIIKRPNYPFIPTRISNNIYGLTEPEEFYELYMENVWNLLVQETNTYAQQKAVAGWINIDVDEMRLFIGLCLKMGQVRLPFLRDYWNTSGQLTPTPVAASVMSRDRFEAILSNLHVADNAANNGTDRLYKISPLINIFNDVAGRLFIPGTSMCVDESLVPFRGRIIFRQYIPNKRYRYGIKLFKLCAESGYTCKLKVYADQEASKDSSVSEKIVLHLVDNYLDQGRDLYTDNYYTGIPLAEKLINRNTNIIGTCRKNWKGLPKEVLYKKLKKGELIARQRKGIMVLKFKDKRDVIMLSTKHDSGLSQNSKSFVIEDYNKGKLFVDTSDQMCSYLPFVRKTTKWYIRLLFHIITQTMMVNSWVLYKNIFDDIKFYIFKRQVFVSLLNPVRPSTPSTRHKLEKVGSYRESRKRCLGCYQKHAKTEDSRTAAKKTKQVNTRCTKCAKAYCLDCFNNLHNKCNG